MRSALICFLLLLVACGRSGSLCDRHFRPYADIVSGRMRTPGNTALLDGMAAYNDGAFPKAIPQLTTYIKANNEDQQARLYLVNSLIGAGKPFDAELQLDFMEQGEGRTFKDQIAWYRTICLLCSDQRDRALRSARAIASSQEHTYRSEAQHLVEDLGGE
ncbi:MAG: hypothetical protein ABI599_15390 [Flavobacteriales bacterium]